MASLLWLVMLLPTTLPETSTLPAPRKEVSVLTERFVAPFKFNEITLAVMYPTTVTLYSKNSRAADAVPTPYHDIPDEDTELVEIGIDIRRRVILKMVYITRKEI